MQVTERTCTDRRKHDSFGLSLPRSHFHPPHRPSALVLCPELPSRILYSIKSSLITYYTRVARKHIHINEYSTRFNILHGRRTPGRCSIPSGFGRNDLFASGHPAGSKIVVFAPALNKILIFFFYYLRVYRMTTTSISGSCGWVAPSKQHVARRSPDIIIITTLGYLYCENNTRDSYYIRLVYHARYCTKMTNDIKILIKIIVYWDFLFLPNTYTNWK